MTVSKKTITIEVLSDNPRRRRKLIKSEIAQGINFEGEFLDDDKILYMISDYLEDTFYDYLKKYKDIKII